MGAIPIAAGVVTTVLFDLAVAALLLRGMARRNWPHLGPANAVTAARAALVGVAAGLAAASGAAGLVGAAGAGAAVPGWLWAAVLVPAVLLDGVDGWVARRTGTASELGARFDMEVDAALLLVLSGAVAPVLGPWVLAIGLMRYAYVAAGWVLPWLRGRLPFRYWRKVAAASQAVALSVVLSGVVPALLGSRAALAVEAVLVGAALTLLVESFGRDVLWLWRRCPAPGSQPGLTLTRRQRLASVACSTPSTTSSASRG